MAVEIVDLDNIPSTDLQASLDLLLQLMLEQRPDLDLGPATALRQVVVDPASLFGSLNQAQLDRLSASWSLAVVAADPTLADDTLVDQIASNFLVTRGTGSEATGKVVIVISERVTTPLPGNVVFTSNGIDYAPTQPFTGVVNAESVISDRDRLIQVRTDGNYYFIVDVAAVDAGAGAQAKRDASFTAAPAIANFVEAYAEADFTGGTDSESTADLIARLSEGISARSTADRSSIRSIILDAVPATTQVSLIGFGDPEMNRDRYNLAGISLGGKCDAYVRTAPLPLLTKVTKTATLDDVASQRWRVSFGRDEVPGFYRVERILTEESSSLGTLEITSDDRAMDLTDKGDGKFVPRIDEVNHGTFTRYQTATIKFIDSLTVTTDLVAGASTKDYDFYVRAMPDLSTVQDTLFSDRTRKDPNADYLARAPIPCFVSVGLAIQYRQASGVPSTRSIQEAVASAVNGLDFSEPRLSVSYIVDAVHNIVGSNGFVDLPVDLRGVLRLPDNTELLLADSDALVVPDYLTQGVSRRTTSFYLDPDDVEVHLSVSPVKFV